MGTKIFEVCKKARHLLLKEGFYFIVVVIALIVLVAAIRYGVFIRWQIRWMKEAEVRCLEHGYPDTRFHLPQRKAYCVGVENGSTVIIPVEELK